MQPSKSIRSARHDSAVLVLYFPLISNLFCSQSLVGGVLQPREAKNIPDMPSVVTPEARFVLRIRPPFARGTDRYTGENRVSLVVQSYDGTLASGLFMNGSLLVI